MPGSKELSQRQRENFNFSVFDGDELMQHILSAGLQSLSQQSVQVELRPEQGEQPAVQEALWVAALLVSAFAQLSALLHTQLYVYDWNTLV